MMTAENMLAEHTLAGLLQDFCGPAVRADIKVAGLALDSRKVQAGDLFLAVAGTRTHGMQHARQAIALGAVAVAWEPVAGNAGLAEAAALLPAPVVTVPGLSQVVGLIAERFYGYPSRGMFMIGVTGTDGKTSCAHFIAQTMNSEDRRCGVSGTLGNGLYGDLATASHTTPDALSMQQLLLSMQQKGARCVVSEVSSHAMDQGRVRGVNFDLAVLTNLSRDHLDYHGTVEAYAEAKRKLFYSEGLRYAVINADDAFGSALLDAIPPGVAPVAYRLENEPFRTRCPAQWVIGRNLQSDMTGMSMDVVTPWGSGELRCGLLGRFNASNLLATLASVCVAGLPFEEAMRRLANIRTVPGRMERFDTGAGHPLTVVDYAHTPAALKAALKSLRAHCSGKLWCVFGAGGDRDRGKRPEMGAVAECHADQLVLTDDNPRTEDPQKIVDDVCSGIKQPARVHIEHDRAHAIAWAMRNAGADDIVLIAGKGHETVQQVGNRSLPFSDRERVQMLAREWAQ
jgi:UDP-N-acetylmuramoyl-L-alanyl-D-glutamate--2,6-diaminopimelate ligase